MGERERELVFEFSILRHSHNNLDIIPVPSTFNNLNNLFFFGLCNLYNFTKIIKIIFTKHTFKFHNLIMGIIWQK